MAQGDQDTLMPALWQSVLDAWRSEARHQAFLLAAHERGDLAGAAKHYREALDDPAKREKAGRQLKAIAALAMASLDNTAIVKRPSTQLGRWLLVGALLIATLALAYYLVVTG